MCGICGIYQVDGAPVDHDLVRRMNNTLSHRGPDDEGYHFDNSIGLGHRRLSIIDLNSGHQPIYNEDKTKVIVYNGEVYNFQEIRKQLMHRGHRFTTQTDTEVLLHAYEEWGADCLEKFRGMFALAIWDSREQTLFIARDRLGIKPLYYCLENGAIRFGSELKAIIADPRVKREIDLEAVSDYLSLSYIPAPKTIFKNIYKLPAGHTLLIRKNGNILTKYWDLPFVPDNKTREETFKKRIVETLSESIQMRLISDVPLGAFLSGGVDSSAVVAVMAQLTQTPVRTNSVGFSVREYSELEYAKRTSLLFATRHSEFMVTPDAVDIVNKLAWFYDEPFADSSSIPTYYVSEMTRRNVTVALSGDGGDENFAGYRRYFYDRLESRIRNVFPGVIRNTLISGLARLYPKADWLPQMFRAKTLLANIASDHIAAHFRSVSHFSPEMKHRMLAPGVKRQLMGYDSVDVFRTHYKNYDDSGINDPLSRVQYVDFKTYIVDDILTKVDRASMANSLEVRVPLLDHKFVELAARIPSRMKLDGARSKIIFKDAMQPVLGDEIINRKKMGFSIPVGQWMKNELRELIEDEFFSSSNKCSYLFDMNYIRQMWRNHLSGVSNYTEPLWCLIAFQLWSKRFM